MVFRKFVPGGSYSKDFFTSHWWPALLLVFSRMFFGKALTQITSDMLHLMLLKVFTFVGEGAVIA